MVSTSQVPVTHYSRNGRVTLCDRSRPDQFAPDPAVVTCPVCRRYLVIGLSDVRSARRQKAVLRLHARKQKRAGGRADAPDRPADAAVS